MQRLQTGSRSAAAWIINRPAISYYQAVQAWFLYHDKMYSVSGSPIHIFRMAVLDADSSARSIPLMQQPTLDMIERWYILLRTTNGVYPLRLFSYKERSQFCRLKHSGQRLLI